MKDGVRALERPHHLPSWAWAALLALALHTSACGWLWPLQPDDDAGGPPPSDGVAADGAAADRSGSTDARSDGRATPVPRPTVAAPSDPNLLVGAHYFPGWKYPPPDSVASTWGWSRISAYLAAHNDRRPLLGFYNEGSAEVADWEIKFALEHGISYFVCRWFRDPTQPHEATRLADSIKTLGEEAIRDGLLQSAYRTQFHFAIMWENVGGDSLFPKNVGGTEAEARHQLLEVYFPYWQRELFSKPSYLKLDGAPVLFINGLDKLITELGAQAKVSDAFAALRARAKEAGHSGLIIGCRHGGEPAASSVATSKAAGCDFAFVAGWSFSVASGSLTTQQAASQQQTALQAWRSAADTLPTAPVVSMGWDPRPWGVDDPRSRYRLPPTGKDSFETLLTSLRAQLAAWPLIHGRKLLIMDQWNGWGDGAIIAPILDGGFGYLDAVRRILTGAPQHLDARPLSTIDSWFCDSSTEHRAQCDLAPIGWIDTVTKDGFFDGWALDPSRAGTPVTVEIYIDGEAATNLVGEATANQPRPDVTAAEGWPGDHGFRYPIPVAFRNSKQHTIAAHGRSATSMKTARLGNSLTFTCPATGSCSSP